jgi:serine/threonine protein kinase
MIDAGLISLFAAGGNVAERDLETAGPVDPRRFGPYRPLTRLGQGGAGDVHLGETLGGHLVVLKVLSEHMAGDTEWRERFAREVAAARRVSGIFTAAVLDADTDGPEPWLATQYIAGPTLAQAVAERGALPEPPLAALGAGLAEGLAAIHAAGVVHRDLKPSNVILAADGPRIIDFGIARMADEAETASPGLIFGTPPFMSPEQAVGQVAGPESDIFSLGGVLTFAATGHPPFPGETFPELLHRVVTGKPDLSGVPDTIAPLVTLCLEKDPARRPTAATLTESFHSLGTREIGGELADLREWLGDTTRHGAGRITASESAPRYPTTTLGRPDVARMPGAGSPPLAAYDSTFHGYAVTSEPEPAYPPSAPADWSEVDWPEVDWPEVDYPTQYPVLPQPLPEPPGGTWSVSEAEGGSGESAWKGLGEPQPGRFLTGTLPERAPSGARISLLVQVTLAAVDGASARIKAFPISPAGTTVTITVSAPGLVPLGDLEQDLTVPFAADSEPVRFGFLAGQVGLHTVVIRAFAGGTCLGELSLQISVETRVVMEEGRPRTAPMAGLAAEPGEVTLQVSRTGNGGYSFQLLSETLYPVVLVDRLAGDPARVVTKIAAELLRMSKGQSPYATAAYARDRLRALGTELWADVVPEAIRRQFWAQRDRITLFTIASDMDTVPWELVYPVDLENEDGFLVEQFPVVRRVYGQGRARALRLDSGAGFIVPPRSPANALEEVEAVRRILSASVPDRGVESGLAQVFAFLGTVPSVLHFAGHNAFTEEGGSVISLDGGPLHPDDLSYARQKRSFAGVSPLVFLNGCRTAGEIAGFSQMNGWAEKFMGAGAGAFIGTLWAVRSSSAKVFAEEFYRQLVTEQQSLGTASLRARQAIAADMGDPTWLAYTVYGNPSASVERS